jgi:hypothetical protein
MSFLEANMIWSSFDALDVLFRIRNDNQIVMRDTFDIDSPFYDTAKNVIEIITDTLMEVSEHGEGEEVFVYFSTHGDRVIADPNTNNTRFQEFVYLPQCMIITAVSFLLKYLFGCQNARL